MTIREKDLCRHREAPSRRRALGLLAATPLLLPGQAGAQTDWPSKPVRVVSPSTGGITDTHCRIVFEALSDRLGQRFYVDGKPGAGGGISAQIAARSPADGYTLLFCIASLIVTNPFVYTKLLYDIDRDFDPVALLAWAPFAILARESLAVRSMPELAEHIRANPGKVTFANVAPGSLAHLVGEQWIQRIGGRAEMVPYRSVPQTMLALSSGEMDVFVAPIGEAKAGIAGGKIRGLGVTTAKRLEALPDVPTLEEQGYPGFDVAGWYGVLAPKGTPRPIVEKLNRELNAVISDPAYRERVIGLGAVAAEPLAPEAFGASYRAEAERWKAVIERIGLKLE
ncbi:MAG: tripartite tricarboxylate transporter substrate binding protein [Enhydrobacter sp.]|nr:tripartite tricarboxylate transporter substrate binding protein [Enhydrobacter sp.]